MTVEAQSSNSVLLVRPAAFGFHPEAAQSNAFASELAVPDLQQQILREFDGMAERLAAAGVDVLVLNDRPDPAKPDAVFPNNWVSFHADGTIVLFPMATAARRLERCPDALIGLLASASFTVREVIDLSGHEAEGRYLEGTGSLILDRPRRLAYASLAPRTDPAVISEFDAKLGYSTFTFDARDRNGNPIYHTNVLMSLGTDFAVLCTDVVATEHRSELFGRLTESGRMVIEIDYDQMRQFACNILEVRGRSGNPLIAMSAAALASLRPDQLRQLEAYGEPIAVPIPTIERVGGGSVRCMIADIHLPRGA